MEDTIALILILLMCLLSIATLGALIALVGFLIAMPFMAIGYGFAAGWAAFCFTTSFC